MKRVYDVQRVLIVDDEPNVAEVLAESLKTMQGGYTVDIASDGQQALALLRQIPYSLVITDYKMPGMNGLDLARQARRISPGTQIVLMTAFGTEGLRDAAGKLQLDGYIDKPFTIQQIREIVENAVACTREQASRETGKHTVQQPVFDQLKTLQANTGARCIVLLSSGGYPIETAGQTGGLDITSIAALVAANFIAAAELAKLLGRGSVFKSSYHEGHDGTDYNIYAYDIDSDFLLAVVFGAESKPGVVWFYTKQAANALAPLVKEQARSVSLAARPTMPAASPETAGEDGISTTLIHKKEKSIGIPAQLLSIEEAIASGLLPAEFYRNDSEGKESFGQIVSGQLDTLWDGKTED